MIKNKKFVSMTLQTISGSNGYITIGNIRIVWGTVHSTSFTKTDSIGGYTYNVDLSPYKFTGNLYTGISCTYLAGIAKVGFASVTESKAVLACSSSVNGLYLRWVVLGQYTG